jgi:two-component system sensor kinase FixL
MVHVARLSAMGEMASAIAHELNQPLTAIINYAQTARAVVKRRSGEGAEQAW